MLELSELIKQRQVEFEKSPENSMKQTKTEYNKSYAKAVKCFQERINLDRKKEKKPPIEFIAVKMKLLAVKEIDDLRIWYRECLKYSYTKDKRTGKRNTFSRAFFGGTKI